MFFIEKNEGLYLELCLLLDYIEDDQDLEWLGFYKHKWETEGLSQLDIKEVVNLINRYLPSNIECTKSGCVTIDNNEIIDAEFVDILD